MERLTKRVGCGEAVPVAEGDICAPYKKAGLCKTGIQGGLFGTWERHCNDTCVLGTIIDKLAAYEDTGVAPEDVVSVIRCKDCDFRAFDDVCKEYYCDCVNGVNGPIEENSYCSYGERRKGE